jgi:RNA polymerase sigma factor FliA
MEANVKAIELKELWGRYKEEEDETAGERLVLAYSPLVKYVTGRMARACRPTSRRPTSSPTASWG